jgi:hypothetical protein
MLLSVAGGDIALDPTAVAATSESAEATSESPGLSHPTCLRCCRCCIIFPFRFFKKGASFLAPPPPPPSSSSVADMTSVGDASSMDSSSSSSS